VTEIFLSNIIKICWSRYDR